MAGHFTVARTFGPDALGTEPVAVSPPLAYLLFKAAHLCLHATADAAAPGHGFRSDAPSEWAAQWTAPAPCHVGFLGRVVPAWGPRDGGALGCVELDGEGRASFLPEGVPPALRPFMDPRVAANPAFASSAAASSLLARLAAALSVAVALPSALRVARVDGASVACWSGEPLAVLDGLDALVVPTPSCAAVVQWGHVLPPSLRGTVSGLAVTTPVLCNAGVGRLLLAAVHVDAGALAAGWADATAPQDLVDCASHPEARDVSADFDAVVLPWLPKTVARSRVPCLEGLAHPLRDERGAAVVERAVMHATVAWDAEAAAGDSSPRSVLALVEACALAAVLSVDGRAVLATLTPGHLFGRLGAGAATGTVRLPRVVVPWGRQ